MKNIAEFLFRPARFILSVSYKIQVSAQLVFIKIELNFS